MKPILMGSTAPAVLAILFFVNPHHVTMDGSGNQTEAPDLLDQQAIALAGKTATNCGTAVCALAAQKAGKPFRIRYYLRTFEASHSVAFVLSPTGTSIEMEYWDIPPGGVGPARTHEVVHQYPCPEPVVFWLNPRGRLECFKEGASPITYGGVNPQIAERY
jgi:hypothetical protein